jgi:hypothetical protein
MSSWSLGTERSKTYSMQAQTAQVSAACAPCGALLACLFSHYSFALLYEFPSIAQQKDGERVHTQSQAIQLAERRPGSLDAPEDMPPAMLGDLAH